MFPWKTYDPINKRGSSYIAKFNKEPLYILFPDSIKEDYKRYIPVKSNGFTKIGIQYINMSIETFIYSILGSQARTKQSIYSNRASALETQQEFRDLVKDNVINYNVSTWINNMNRAITDTNIILNMAVSPSLWLLSNNLILLKNPIPGYNNRLKIASKDTKFGINEKLNYVEHHLNTLKTKLSPPETKLSPPQTKLSSLQTKLSSPKDNHNSDLIIILVLSTASGYIVSKYVL